MDDEEKTGCVMLIGIIVFGLFLAILSREDNGWTRTKSIQVGTVTSIAYDRYYYVTIDVDNSDIDEIVSINEETAAVMTVGQRVCLAQVEGAVTRIDREPELRRCDERSHNN